MELSVKLRNLVYSSSLGVAGAREVGLRSGQGEVGEAAPGEAVTVENLHRGGVEDISFVFADTRAHNYGWGNTLNCCPPIPTNHYQAHQQIICGIKQKIDRQQAF